MKTTLPDPEEIQEKADELAQKSTVGRKVRGKMSWAAIILLVTVLTLMGEAIINRVLLA